MEAELAAFKASADWEAGLALLSYEHPARAAQLSRNDWHARTATQPHSHTATQPPHFHIHRKIHTRTAWLLLPAAATRMGAQYLLYSFLY